MTHTRALIEHVEYEVEEMGIAPIRREGVREGRWAVLDYGDVLVHIFNDESSLFYHLEKLWGTEENITKF
jgi:ribosome-associated protein